MQTVIEAFLWSVTIKGARLWGFLCFCLSAGAWWVIGWFSCRWRVLYNFNHSGYSYSLSFFFSFLHFILFLFCHCFPPHSLCPHSTPPSILFLPLPSPPILTSRAPLSFPLPVNTVIAWGALQCITDLSPLVLFMALSLFKFNQASMEPPEPFQFTTWTPQDGKSYANIKV